MAATDRGRIRVQDPTVAVRGAYGNDLDFPSSSDAVLCDRSACGALRHVWAPHLEPGSYVRFAAYRYRRGAG